MKPLFLQIKCELGQTFKVAADFIDTVKETSEVYSTSGAYDLLGKFYLEEDQNVGRFVVEHIHRIPGIRDTYTLMAFRIFCDEQPDGLVERG